MKYLDLIFGGTGGEWCSWVVLFTMEEYVKVEMEVDNLDSLVHVAVNLRT